MGTPPATASRTRWIAAAGLVAVTAWSFWPTFTALAQRWSRDPQYSHGFLVPLFSIYLLWVNRDFRPRTVTPAPIAGGLMLAFALAMRLAGAWRYHEWIEQISLIPYLFALVLCFGGWPWWKWAGPAAAFLAFMVPLPYRVEVFLGAPLQRLATVSSTFVLQTLGQPAIAEGNTILMNDVRLGIVEACSGLRMLVTFFTFSTAVCLVVRRPLSDKLCILLSAIPIAVAVNILRIVITGVMYLHVDGELAHKFFHDLAGWFMMPMALAFLGLEIWVLNQLIIETGVRGSGFATRAVATSSPTPRRG